MSNARFVFSPERIPQGLKPESLLALSGTPKGVPFQIVYLLKSFVCQRLGQATNDDF
jgi:hypothetical protein